MLFGRKWVRGLKKTVRTRLINRRRTQTDIDILARATLPEQRNLLLRDDTLLYPGHKPKVLICGMRVVELTIRGKGPKSIFALHEAQGVSRLTCRPQTGLRMGLTVPQPFLRMLYKYGDYSVEMPETQCVSCRQVVLRIPARVQVFPCRYWLFPRRVRC